MKILYMMHVEWGWIKQRPHFIAEELSKKYDLKVYYQIMYWRFKRNKNSSFVDKSAFFTVPKKSVFPLGLINSIIMKCFFYIIIKAKNYDVIYLSHPDQLDYLPPTDAKVIYDCMDDHSYFGNSDGNQVIKRKEIRLFDRSDFIIFSSNYLNLKNMSHTSGKRVEVLLNGISENLVNSMSNNVTKKLTAITNIFYVGTIAEWFDFTVIKFILDNCPTVNFTIVGPTDVKLPNFGDRVTFTGSVDHSQIKEMVKDADIFIMPFVPNEMIRSVDPVKMYEYISFCRPIISVYYEELDRFFDFVNFYQNDSHLREICHMINNSSLKSFSDEAAKSFVLDATWTNRIKNVLTPYLDGLVQ